MGWAAVLVGAEVIGADVEVGVFWSPPLVCADTEAGVEGEFEPEAAGSDPHALSASAAAATITIAG